MKHQRFIDLLAIRDFLSPGEAETLDAHLQACPTCRRIAADFARQNTDLRLLQFPEPPSSLQTGVLHHMSQPRARRFWERPRFFLMLAPVALALLLVATFALRGHGASGFNRSAAGTSATPTATVVERPRPTSSPVPLATPRPSVVRPLPTQPVYSTPRPIPAPIQPAPLPSQVAQTVPTPALNPAPRSGLASTAHAVATPAPHPVPLPTGGRTPVPPRKTTAPPAAQNPATPGTVPQVEAGGGPQPPMTGGSGITAGGGGPGHVVPGPANGAPAPAPRQPSTAQPVPTPVPHPTLLPLPVATLPAVPVAPVASPTSPPLPSFFVPGPPPTLPIPPHPRPTPKPPPTLTP